jgi:SAM-dependent methyltransferase
VSAAPPEELLRRWRADLAGWAVPDEIRAQVSESPWVLPRQVFARRAQRHVRQPFGISFEKAFAALDPPGDVLDVGAGAGAACLPLAPRVTGITAVDVEPGMLDMLTAGATALGVTVRTVTGSWPQVAGQVGAVDVVTCHHVLYNVADIAPFVTALTQRARRLVVVEVTASHPLTMLNPLWTRFHGLHRPCGPTADDLLAILRGLGLHVEAQAWTRPAMADYESFAELVDVTRRRLCLPVERTDEVATALHELGADRQMPTDFGSSGRELVTIWWPGAAAG